MNYHGAQLLDDPSHKTSSRLCKVCHQIGTSDSRWFFGTIDDSRPGLAIYIHRRDMHSLKASALKGCMLCQFLLSALVNSDETRRVPTITGDVVVSSALSVRKETQVADRELLLGIHGSEISPASAYFLPTILEDAGETQGLHLLSKLCGKGRVVLVGTSYASLLPFNLRAAIYYPFGAFGVQVHTPFLTGLPFELATGIGTRSLFLIC